MLVLFANLVGMEQPSKSAVRKAGSRIRQSVQSGTPLDQVKASLPMAIVLNYRACFSEPMRNVATALSLLLDQSGTSGTVSFRLKRAETIIDKISNRESGLDLSRMQDIGGCRVVLNSLGVDSVRSFADKVLDRWRDQVLSYRDYYQSPRSSGYRSIHIVVQEMGLPIEIQLRSLLAHQFAQFVESVSQRDGINYKQDVQSPQHEFFQALSHLIADLEETPGGELVRAQALSLLNDLLESKLDTLGGEADE